ncbi:MAG: aspartate aminotransferase family protein [Planctomycetota bacterium]|nr:aspartate aminotransferase family protein [Planctomycetota bacterium]
MTSRLPSWIGPLAILFYIAHGIELLLIGPAVNLLWSCNVASLVICIGLVSKHPKINAVGCFMLCLGNNFWFIDLAVGGEFLWTSLLTHFGVFILSIIAMKKLGLPAGTWWRTIVFMAFLVLVTSWIGPYYPEENINTANALPVGFETWYPSHGGYILTIMMILTVGAFILQALFPRLGFKEWRPKEFKEYPVSAADTEGFEKAIPSLSDQEKEYAKVPASEHPSVLKYARHVNPAFVKLLGMFKYGRLFTKAQDCWIWDHEERRYLDCLAGFGAVNIGHSHPRLLARMASFIEEQSLNFIHVGPSAPMGEFAARLAKLVDDPLDVVILGNTGAEAVEAALKTARAWSGRSDFVYCTGAYHGTSLGTLSIMGTERMRSPFEPLLNGCHRIDFGNLEQLESALKAQEIAAFVVDPGLCEAGAVHPPKGFLKAAQQLCHKHGALLILDEVQTGLGRTGTLFAYQQEDMVPDVLVLAKSLSGGIVPVAATVTTTKIYNKGFAAMDRFDLNNTTFGGNSLSCAVALETLNIIEDEQLVKNSRERGKELLEGLSERLAGHPLVQKIRGRGLFVAIELGPTDQGLVNKLAPGLVKMLSKEVFGQWAAVKLLERGLLCQPATQNWNVLKIEPPLTLSSDQVTQIIDTVGAVLDDYSDVAQVMEDVTVRVGQQFLSGWSF